MTATIQRPERAAAVLARPHRPLLVLAAAMAVGVLACLVLLLVDPRELGGQPLWAKPLKFCLSIAVYALTLAWLIGLVPERRRRLARILGSVAVAGLAIEMVVIGGAAAVGVTSHFNVTTPLHSALWAAMAVSIVVVWLVTLVLAALLARVPLGDPSLTLAVRAGLVIGLVGMALAFLMTGPTASQLSDYQGVVGAHAVGVDDGGAGLPLLGWSTTGGDLRIPHFVGMHALQGLPLLAFALARLGTRVRLLGDATLRLRLVALAALAWSALVALTCWQALRGQSIVAPDALTLAVGGAVVLALVIAGLVAVRRASVEVAR
ncbi:MULTISPECIES: hypothetical protein [unclassified Rathayibacter]|uniref:hypothetical protein n=1 Tax=unclassified Rathayibacter TaxID=2609250 RepID=UPI001046F662|nr:MULTISPECIES: hypothetical protein [unclassified Rathayibacter]MCJ1703501.1 hypothetical protein [Rathayibacter sp. VKM Ac-2926]TCL80379.1 hypothetical protein EDF49_10997 [Rathayibacter sp. PhB192]TCM25905.1 hypothetical protein EDF43_10997 [Rathayibacter sp. PhB179]